MDSTSKALPAGDTAGGKGRQDAGACLSESMIPDTDPQVNHLAAAYRYILSDEWGRAC